MAMPSDSLQSRLRIALGGAAGNELIAILIKAEERGNLQIEPDTPCTCTHRYDKHEKGDKTKHYSGGKCTVADCPCTAFEAHEELPPPPVLACETCTHGQDVHPADGACTTLDCTCTAFVAPGARAGVDWSVQPKAAPCATCEHAMISHEAEIGKCQIRDCTCQHFLPSAPGAKPGDKPPEGTGEDECVTCKHLMMSHEHDTGRCHHKDCTCKEFVRAKPKPKHEPKHEPEHKGKHEPEEKHDVRHHKR